MSESVLLALIEMVSIAIVAFFAFLIVYVCVDGVDSKHRAEVVKALAKLLGRWRPRA